jgi:hypothetical protein
MFRTRLHVKDFPGAIRRWLIIPPYDEDALKHQTPNIVVVRMLGVSRLRIEPFSFDLSVSSGRKFGFEGSAIH